MTESFLGASPMLLLEWWKPIEGYETKYQISNTGNVASLKSGRRLSTSCGKNGYQVAGLWINNRRETRYVHDLVARHFIGVRPDNSQINHKDGFKLMCQASNLEYVSQQVNSDHAVALGLYPRGSRHYRAKMDESMVIEIRKLLGHETQKTIASRLGISLAMVEGVAQGKKWRHVPIEAD